MGVKLLEPGETLASAATETWRLHLLPSECVPLQTRIWIMEPLALGKGISLYIDNLPDDRLRLLRPIPVRLEYEASHFIARCDDFREFGYGRDVFEAIDDLRYTICELFWSLSEREEGLSLDLKRILQSLRSTLEVCQAR